MAFDVTIGGKSLRNDFGLNVLSFEITPPKPRINLIQIPGTSESIDLTEALTGDVEYEPRQITIMADGGHDNTQYFEVYSQLLNVLHGVSQPIVFSEDPGFYWIGRITIEKSGYLHNYGATIEIRAEVEPYKYQVSIPAAYLNVAVSGTKTIEITGLRKRVCPIIQVSAAMTVTYSGKTYNLAIGDNTIPDIFLGSGTHSLLFTGTGTVSVNYRGGSL